MIKNNKWKCIFSSIVILLPMLIGVFAKDLLPEEVVLHFGMDGMPDGWGNPLTFFLAVPPVMLAAHWICLLADTYFSRNQTQNKKLQNLMFWLMPLISLFVTSTMVFAMSGEMPNVSALVCGLMGVLFLVIGNYLPKTTRNLTMGIKIKWAQSSDENWNATHRFGGKAFVTMGVISFVLIPLKPAIALPCFFAVLVLGLACITFYSYCYYQKQLSEGQYTKEELNAAYLALVGQNHKKAAIAVTVVTSLLLVGMLPLMFTGKIEVSLGETALVVDASFWEDVEIAYDNIEAIEYRDSVDGSRLSGFGSAKLSLGVFQNKEFGNYTRYTYTGKKPAIVLTVDGKAVVLGLEDATATTALYQALQDKIQN